MTDFSAIVSELGSLGPDEQKKLKDFVSTAKAILLELEDKRGALADLAKKASDDLGVSKKSLMTTARVAHKGNLISKQEELATVVDILQITGDA